MLKFEDYCEKQENIPNDLLKLKILFKTWRDYIFDIYNNLVCENRTKNTIINNGLVNPIIGCLIYEIITTLDGLYVLASKNSFESIPVLTRKFLEITTQIIFILKDDSYTKALVYELKDISLYPQKDVNSHLVSLKKILNNDNKIDVYYNEIIDLTNKNKYYDWYRIYNSKITSFQKLYEIIDTNIQSPSPKELWQKMYGHLSRRSHGFNARKNMLKIHSSNVLNSFRFPSDISFYVSIINFMAENLIKSINNYYNVLNKAKMEFIFEKQSKICKQIITAETSFNEKINRQLTSKKRDEKRAKRKCEKHKLKKKNKV